MIIADKFVFLHYPKTGGLFIADVLKKLHIRIKFKKFFINAPLCKELMLPNVKRIHGANVYNRHGTYDQIPEEYKDRPIISCIRNPFDYYVSIYEFRNWEEWHLIKMPQIKEHFPSFPDLSFKEYLYFYNDFDIKSRIHSDLLNIDIGAMTYSFIQFFFKDPRKIITNLDENYLNSFEYKKDMPEITFLRSENLNAGLYNVLLKLGYNKKDVSFILNAQKVNVTVKRDEKHWEEYYNHNLYDYIKFKERFIFKLFPEYNEAINAIS